MTDTTSVSRLFAEWHFIQNLRFRDQLDADDAAFVQLVYTARLHSVSHNLGRPESVGFRSD